MEVCYNARLANIYRSLQMSFKQYGRVAQSVEQRIENPRVDSSILSPATNKYKGLVFTKPFFICERDKNVTIRTRYRQFKSQSYLLHLQDAQLQT